MFVTPGKLVKGKADNNMEDKNYTSFGGSTVPLQVPVFSNEAPLTPGIEVQLALPKTPFLGWFPHLAWFIWANY